MTTSKPEATDANLAAEQSVVAGVTAEPTVTKRTRSKSAATKGAAKNAPKSEREPTGAASLRAAEKKSSAPSRTDLQKLIFAELMRRAGDIIDAPPAGVTKAQCREILSQRMRYTPRAGELWDSRLGPAPK